MKRALAEGITATFLLMISAVAADEPSKNSNGTSTGNSGWNFKLTPNSGPLLAEPPTAKDAPLVVERSGTLHAKRRGEPTFTDAPRVWWTGDYLTPLERSRRVIPRSDRVREQ